MGIHSHIQLPNLVLSCFRDDTDPEGKVWYLDLLSGEIRRKPAKRLGTEKGYYSSDIESFWNKTVEDPFGKLNQRMRSFSSGEQSALPLSPQDTETAKQYIKAAMVRSNLADKAMLENSFLAPRLSEQDRHDMLAILAMQLTSAFDQMFANTSVMAIVNRADRRMVVPRNCYYADLCWDALYAIAPISPQCALALLPKEIADTQNEGCFVINDSTQVERMNICALKYEYMFNADFVASSRREELELLQQFRIKNLSALRELTEENHLKK